MSGTFNGKYEEKKVSENVVFKEEWFPVSVVFYQGIHWNLRKGAGIACW